WTPHGWPLTPLRSVRGSDKRSDPQMPRPALTVVLLLAVFGLPLALPLTQLLPRGSCAASADAGRILELLVNPVGLGALTLAPVLPPGVILAVLLYRTDLPCRRFIRSLLAVALFVPLPLFALAWQSAGGGGWRPWTQGLLPAAVVHAAAALPWVVSLVGLGLSRVEPELEEDALTATSAPRVLWPVAMAPPAPTTAL